MIVHRLILLGIAIHHGLVTSLVAAQPTAQMRMVAERLYIGEPAYVRIKVVAPEAQAVEIIRPDRIRAWLGLDSSLLDEEGKVRWRSFSDVLGARKDDLVLLPAGKSMEFEVKIMYARPITGKYSAKVKYRPIKDRSFVIERQLPVVYVDFSPQDITDKTSLRTPADAHQKSLRNLQVEMVKLRENNNCVLYYRRWSRYRIEVFTFRLFPVDADAPVKTRLMNFGGKSLDEQIWVTYKRDKKLRRAKMRFYDAFVLDDQAIDAQGSQNPTSNPGAKK